MGADTIHFTVDKQLSSIDDFIKLLYPSVSIKVKIYQTPTDFIKSITLNKIKLAEQKIPHKYFKKFGYNLKGIL